MVKLIIIFVIALVVYTICKKKEEQNNKKVFYYIHVILGIVFTIYLTIHGISRLVYAPVPMWVTGGLALLLLYSQIIIGVIIHKNPNSKLKTLHKIIPIIILLLFLCHIITLKIGLKVLKFKVIEEIIN